MRWRPRSTALRPFAPGRLVCVFGCGGDRDKGKRPIMGRIAAALADIVIVTDDNPRSENPEAIRAEILAGARARARSATGPRRSAPASRLLGNGDVLLVAGKGHETGQIVGSTVLPFSDHEAVRAALAETADPMAEPLWQWDELVAAAGRPRRRRAAAPHHRLLHRHAHARRRATCSSR